MSKHTIEAGAIGFSYIRFSRLSQKQGRSHDRQMEDCVKWCEKHGVTLSDNTFLDEGKSGYTGDHVGPKGQLRRFLDLVEDGKIPKGSYLVVESLDRLGRESINDALGRFINILNAGVNIVTLMDGERVYTKDFTLEDVLTSVVVMERANNESKTKASRSKDNWAVAFDRARTEKKPVGKQVAMWLELVDVVVDGVKKKEYREREDRVKIVDRIFRECIAGHGFVAIAKSLNADNEPAFRGGTWCASSIKEILDNRCVLGEWNPKDGKGVIRGYFPVVVQPDTWDAAQLAMKDRRGRKVTKSTPEFQIWQQVGMCATCGANMNLLTKGGGKYQYKYMGCSGKRKGLCDSGYVRADHSERVFKEILVKVGALGLIQSDAAAITDRINAVGAEVVKQQQLLEQHAAAVSTYGANPAFYKLIADTSAEIARLESERQQLQEQHASEAAVQADKGWLIDNLPLKERDERQRANTLLRRLDVKVRIRGGANPVYVCLQRGIPFLQLMPVADDIVPIPLNAEQRVRFKEQDVNGQDRANVDDWLYAKLGVYSKGAKERAEAKQ